MTSFAIIAEDVKSHSVATVAEPNEPAPIFLVGLNSAKSLLDRRKQRIADHISSPATLVNVLFGVGDRDNPTEAYLERHIPTNSLKHGNVEFIH